MDEETLNTSVRKFLKTFGVTAQREFEKAVRDAVLNGQLKDCPSLPAKAVVTVGGINLKFEIDPADRDNGLRGQRAVALQPSTSACASFSRSSA